MFKLMQGRQYDLEDRLVLFGVNIIKLCEGLPPRRGTSHLGGQLIRSGSAPALIYGEAQSAESRRDFIHKMKLVLKELRESRVSLKMLRLLGALEQARGSQELINECQELILIFSKSVKTAQEKEE